MKVSNVTPKRYRKNEWYLSSNKRVSAWLSCFVVVQCMCHASNEVERMTALIGDMEKARRLIESTSTNAVDSEWVHQAARIFYRRNPASPPLSLSSNAIPAKTASRPVIKTTYKIKKTADGKLEKQVATTEIPTDAGTNK